MKFFEGIKKHWRPTVVGGLISGFCALFFLGGVFHSWSARISDRLFSSRPVDDRIVIVAIDDDSLSRVGRWPWDRSIHAELIRTLTRAGASVIAYDVNFSESQNGEEDAELASAIQSSRRIILPTELVITEIDSRLVAGTREVISPLSVFGSAAIRTGFSNTPTDDDGVVRAIPLRVFLGGERLQVYPFAFEAAQSFDDKMSVADAPMDRLSRIIISYPGEPKKNYPTISAADILEGRFRDDELRGKLVFVGSTAADLHDQQLVPTSASMPMPGVEIHASFADTLLQKRWIRQLDSWIFVLLLVGLGLLQGWVISRFRLRWSVPIVLFFFLGSLAACAVAFEFGVIMDALWMAIAIVFSFIAVLIERRVTAEKDRRVLRQIFEHYVSPSVVDLIVRNPSKLKLGGERRKMSILFSDIRVFTALTETMSPEILIQKLNTYFNRMTEEVFGKNGVLDKYMGDGLMAFWNAPFDQPDHALLAIESALAMQKALAELNREGAFGNPPWRVGIGINTGEVIVGNIGGEHHADYTVVGDAVNLASRLEGLTREYNVDIIISEQAATAVKEKMLLRKIDQVVVKGRFQAVAIYEVLCESSQATVAQKELVELYEKMLGVYCERNFDEVIFQCHQLLTKYPNDGPTLVIYERARAFLETPPPAGWDGIWVFTEK